ncbi:MAG: hypothetical protein ACON46_08795 [Coraliomargaritaceae bacterium]
MNKQPVTKKGLILGIILLNLAVLSTLLIISLRPKAEAEAEAEATTEERHP